MTGVKMAAICSVNMDYLLQGVLFLSILGLFECLNA